MRWFTLIWQLFFAPARFAAMYGYGVVVGGVVFAFFLIGVVLTLSGIDLGDPASTANRPGGLGDWLVFVVSRGLFGFILLTTAGIGAALVGSGVGGFTKRPFGGIGKLLGGLLVLYFAWVGVSGWARGTL